MPCWQTNRLVYEKMQVKPDLFEKALPAIEKEVAKLGISHGMCFENGVLKIWMNSGDYTLNTKTGPSQNDSRGASALTDGVRWQLVLTTVTPQHKDFKPLQAIAAGHYVEAALVKSNYTAPQASVHLRREPDGYLQAVQATPTSPIANPALMQLLQVISKSSCPLTAKQIETSFCGRGKAIKVGQKRSRELMKEARDAGLTQGHGLIPVTLTREGQAILASAGGATIPDSAAAAAKAVAAAGRQTAALPLATGKC